MKKKYLALVPLLAALMLMAGCNKEQTCRCAVRNSSVVRILDIDKGSCHDIKVFRHRDELDSLYVDSLLCTSYRFAIDSIYDK